MLNSRKMVITMMDYQRWFEYAKFDEDVVCVCGIKEDAPDEIKKEYAEYLKEREIFERNGIKV